MPNSKRIVWADDEIDILKPHILFLEKKGYQVISVYNGEDAVSVVKNGPVDIVLLDENMPGCGGLETVRQIKEINPQLPVVMITKSEAEELMNEAIGKKIDDYLIKPVVPSQILSVCKKLIEAKQIYTNQIVPIYIQQYREHKNLMEGAPTWQEWIKVHRRLTQWDIELAQNKGSGLEETHRGQREEMAGAFGKYIAEQYPQWIKGQNPPPLSKDVLGKFVVPLLAEKKPVFFILIDCMRLDQWLMLERILADYYQIERDYYYSILPTATPYSRNAIFSGCFLSELAQAYPDLWERMKDDENSHNRYEHQLMERYFEKIKLQLSSEPKYLKILDIQGSIELLRKIKSYLTVPFTSVVINFLDMLSHGRSESDVLTEIAPDEAALRDLTEAWFKHSNLLEILSVLAQNDCIVVITTDHGSILGSKGVEAYGGKEISKNLRYKYGENVTCDERHAVFIANPDSYKLPQVSLNTRYIIAKENYYFVYPSKFQYYQKKYRNSFQHGGISLEEMILPIAVMRPK